MGQRLQKPMPPVLAPRGSHQTDPFEKLAPAFFCCGQSNSSEVVCAELLGRFLSLIEHRATMKKSLGLGTQD